VQVVVVLLVLVVQSQSGGAPSRSISRGVGRDRLGPEQAAAANARVEIVNLAGANWPCEQINSNEREGPVVLVAILADIQSGHKPIVDLVVETAPCSCRRVGASSRPGYPTYAHQSIEVGDLWGSLIGPGPNTGTGGKWSMKIPNGDTPHGIGRGKTVGTASCAASARGTRSSAATAPVRLHCVLRTAQFVRPAKPAKPRPRG
jgi:hypothetical protein